MLILLIVYDNETKSVLAMVYETYGDTMLKVAKQYLTHEDSEDALQDIMEKLAKKYQGDWGKMCDHGKGFFVVITKNHCLDVLRKKKREPVFTGLEDDFIFIDSTLDPDILLTDTDDKNALILLIKQLKPSYREVLEYKYLLGYSNIEIADMLGVSSSVISTRMERARNKLKVIIENRGGLCEIY